MLENRAICELNLGVYLTGLRPSPLRNGVQSPRAKPTVENSGRGHAGYAYDLPPGQAKLRLTPQVVLYAADFC